MRYLAMLLPDRFLRKVDRYLRKGRHNPVHVLRQFEIPEYRYVGSRTGSVVYA